MTLHMPTQYDRLKQKSEVGFSSPFNRLTSRSVTWIATIVVIAVGLYCIPSFSSASVSQSDKMQEKLEAAASLIKFSLELYQAIGKNVQPTENICFSPLSVAAVLGMVGAGARGETASQLKHSLSLHHTSDEKSYGVIGSLVKDIKGDGSFTLKAANQLYVAEKYKLLDSYQNLLKESYGAPAQTTNFGDDESRISINKWVEDYTHQKIKELLPQGSINSLTRLVLVNAIYFKGNWMRAFDSSKTKQQPFYLGSDDKKVNVNMMHMEAEFRNGFSEDLDARILEIPYVDGKLSMFIVLPNKVDGLNQLESKLNVAALDEAIRFMPSRKIPVAIPKFKLEADLKIKEVLIEMGLTHIFNADKADFSGISGVKDLFVSDMFHKSFIDVNEEGSEAAAATGAIMMTRSMIFPIDPPQPFIADHPFYFFIRENTTNLVLFSGRLVQPPSN